MGVIIIALFSFFIDLRQLNEILRNFNYYLLPIIIFLAPLNYFFRFCKWHFYLKLIGVNLIIRESLVIFFSGLSMTITPGKLGELLKSYMLKNKYAVSMSVTAPLVFTERLTDAISLLILSCIGLLVLPYGVIALIVLASFMIIGVILIQRRNLCLHLIQLLSKLPVFKEKVQYLYDFYNSTYILFKWDNLLFAVTIGVVSWAFEGFVAYFSLLAMGYHIHPLASIFVVSFSSIVGALSLLPGGLITTEGSIMGLLLLMKYPKTVAAGVTIITRMSTLWLGVGVGFLFLLFAVKKGYLDTTKDTIDVSNSAS